MGKNKRGFLFVIVKFLLRHLSQFSSFFTWKIEVKGNPLLYCCSKHKEYLFFVRSCYFCPYFSWHFVLAQVRVYMNSSQFYYNFCKRTHYSYHVYTLCFRNKSLSTWKKVILSIENSKYANHEMEICFFFVFITMYFTQLLLNNFRSGFKMTSSDDDIDPELKEGIKNIM